MTQSEVREWKSVGTILRHPPAKWILATTKDRGRRVYLDQGVFAEPEYWYQRGEFTILPWTFPDYRQDACRELFLGIRQTTLKQLAAMNIPRRAHPAPDIAPKETTL